MNCSSSFPSVAPSSSQEPRLRTPQPATESKWEKALVSFFYLKIIGEPSIVLCGRGNILLLLFCHAEEQTQALHYTELYPLSPLILIFKSIDFFFRYWDLNSGPSP
jgi:hypothetical protein